MGLFSEQYLIVILRHFLGGKAPFRVFSILFSCHLRSGSLVALGIFRINVTSHLISSSRFSDGFTPRTQINLPRKSLAASGAEFHQSDNFLVRQIF